MAALRRPVLVLVALSALGVMGGCGGKSGLSKAELIAKGDALCTEARKASPPTVTSNQPLAIANYFDQLDKVSTATLAKFRKLKPRASERKVFAEFLAAAEHRLLDVRKARDAARAGSVGGAAAAVRADSQRDAPRYRALTTRIGFKVCGGGG